MKRKYLWFIIFGFKIILSLDGKGSAAYFFSCLFFHRGPHMNAWEGKRGVGGSFWFGVKWSQIEWEGAVVREGLGFVAVKYRFEKHHKTTAWPLWEIISGSLAEWHINEKHTLTLVLLHTDMNNFQDRFTVFLTSRSLKLFENRLKIKGSYFALQELIQSGSTWRFVVVLWCNFSISLTSVSLLMLWCPTNPHWATRIQFNYPPLPQI